MRARNMSPRIISARTACARIGSSTGTLG